MPRSLKGRTEAQRRYDEANPVISIRLSRSEETILQEIAARLGITKRELLMRRARATINKERIHAQGWLQGVNEAPWLHIEACLRCNAQLAFDLRVELDRSMYRWQRMEHCLHPDEKSTRLTEWTEKLNAARTAQNPSTAGK